MKPYYKNGGFFDRLERLSDWIDDHIDRSIDCFHFYGIMYFIPGFSRLSVYKFWIREHFVQHEYIRFRYNREKYWWMRAK